MSGARSQRLHGSLGDSWGDADYSSDDGASIHSASDLSEAGSESDIDETDREVARQEHSDIATPLPPRATRASSRTSQGTPIKTPVNPMSLRNHRQQTPRSTPRSNRSYQSTPGSESMEPSFIMPSMRGSVDGFHNGSPLRASQIRARKPRQSSYDQPSSMHSSPRISSRQTSAKFLPVQPDREEEQEVGPGQYFRLFSNHVLWPLVRYIMDVVSYAMNHFMKPFLGFALGVFLLISIIQMTSGLLQKTIQTALTPVCILPGSSYILPFCVTTSHEGDYADFEELANVQSKFEDIIDASKDSFELPATMKSSETTIRDLRTLVKFSRLPSRSELEVEFDYFIETARQASADLTRYNSKIGATIDRIISTNTWTMTVLEGLAENDASAGAIGRVFNAMTGVFIAPPPTLQQRIFDQYLRHVTKNKEEINELIKIAQALLLLLHHLEERLDAIYSIATRDDNTITKNQDELLSLLWTKLGGNAASRKENQRQLALLKDVTSYRKKAISLVGETLLKLQEIAAGLENLREDVAAPEVLGWRDEVPLTYHIEAVGKSLDRLRISRGDMKRVEGEQYNRIVRGGDIGEERALPAGKSQTQTVYAK